MKSIYHFINRRLEFKILALILFILVISFSGIFFIISSKERQSFVEDERLKSKLVADTIHEALDRDMMAFRADIVRFLMEDMKKLEGIKRIQIVRGDAPYVGEGRGRDEGFMDFKTLNDVKQRVTTLYRPEWERDHADLKSNVASGTDRKAFKEYFSKIVQSLNNTNLTTKEEEALKRGMLDTTYFEEIDGVPVMTYLRPLPNFPKCALCHGTGYSIRGILMISTSMEGVNAALKQSQRNLSLAFVGTVLVLVYLLRSMIKRIVLAPVNTVGGRVKEIAEGGGDLTARIEVNYQDEIGGMARWFNRFVEKLHHIMAQVSRIAKQVKTVSQQVFTGTRQMTEGGEVQIRAIESTGVAVEAVNVSINKVATNAASLSALAEESAVAILQMSSSIDEIARSAAVLSSTVEDTTASILEMSSSSKQIDENVSSLNAAAEETASSMVQMDSSIKQIRSNVMDTVQISKEVTEDAERGRRATELTIQGIHKIQVSSQQVNDVIVNLKARTESIGKILNVIGEVAEQTNLLALNAAIIAAQAGEHGKSFSVVAQEIKELADRTATSTKEIHDIIRSLQDESKNAVLAINHRTKSVEEGVHLAGEAGEALNKILSSSQQSTRRIQEIAKATDEQTNGVKRVWDSMHHITEMVQQIVHATHEQFKGSELMIGAIEKMKDIAAKVKHATQEQSIGNRQINELVERVANQVKEIAQATGQQVNESAKILKALGVIKPVVEQNMAAIGNVGKAIEELLKQSTQLSGEVEKFKL
ncbi:MAG TPA: HAMP domain-containing methyl-accepting chemotaxis protein [Nitrospiria bacterium]|jgi:methyl-accepting chemotaxis protein|nr:HAMP domain-containing methyl-accepting chemotaxis protein [Nitrospiria bacterium]